MEYLDKLLETYSQTFDLQRDYRIGQLTADAYGYFFTCSEKFVLSPKANLWSIHGYEHILFIRTDTLTLQNLTEARSLMEHEMIRDLVCRGNRFPEKDHMYSYLTFAFLCQNKPMPEVIRAVEQFRYEKDFLLTLRGHAEGHIICMDLSGGKAYANKKARHLISFYEETFKKEGSSET